MAAPRRTNDRALSLEAQRLIESWSAGDPRKRLAVMYRLGHGWTQAQVARELGVNRRTIIRWLNDFHTVARKPDVRLPVGTNESVDVWARKDPRKKAAVIYRLGHGWTHAAIADEVGVTRQTVHNWIRSFVQHNQSLAEPDQRPAGPARRGGRRTGSGACAESCAA